MVEVVAALIWESDRFLICQRPKSKARGLLWEFVGGKVEKGETKQLALKRECMEELGVTVAIEELYFEITHAYPDITVHLSLYTAKIISGTIKKIEHNDIKWITTEEISEYDFCPADEAILEKLKEAKI